MRRYNIWHVDEYNRSGEAQLAGYLDDYHLKKGYLLIKNPTLF